MLRDDRSRPPLLTPLALLGCKVEVLELAAGSAYKSGQYMVWGEIPSAGGSRLQRLHLDEGAFGASAMQAGGELAFEFMKLPQLKEELAARDSKRSGLKAVLQRRLHGLLVEAEVAARAAEAEENGEGMDVSDSDDEAADASFWEAVEAVWSKSKAAGATD